MEWQYEQIGDLITIWKLALVEFLNILEKEIDWIFSRDIQYAWLASNAVLQKRSCPTSPSAPRTLGNENDGATAPLPNIITTNKKTNSVVCSPQAIYTDRATAACRRS
jgi:hypothetical protein